MELEPIGTLGMLLLVIAWIPETIQNYKEKGKNLNPKFVVLYFVGATFLAYHALLLKDLVFLALNAITAILSIFNGYLIYVNRMQKNKLKSKAS